MKDIREQVLENNGVFNILREDAPLVQEHIIPSMDEYAIKILDWLHDNNIDFRVGGFNAKEYLEEIKTELNNE